MGFIYCFIFQVVTLLESNEFSSQTFIVSENVE